MIKSICSLVILFVLISCNKDINEINENSSEQNAINEVKKIVGNQGNLFVLRRSNNNNLQSFKLKDNNVDKIKIEKYKEIFDKLIKDTLPHIYIQLSDSVYFNDDEIRISALKSLYDFDGPKPAGLYRYSYGPLQNGNSSLFTNMNIAFNTNHDGSIDGSPTIYFSGITLFGWQAHQISQISFNPKTFVSTFAITGTTTFGIQCSGGLTIGWTSTTTFYVRINMDDNDPNTVVIRGYK